MEMATLGDMRTRIADELQIDATVYSTEIDRAVFSAIEFYNEDDFWFLESMPTNILLTSTTNYDLGTVLPGRSQIVDVILQITPTREPLFYRSPTELLEMAYDDNFTGEPLYYTVHADNLIVRPKPNRTFTAETWYSLRRSMTASACATSVWMVEGEELIRMHAEADVLENRIKDYEEAARKRVREEQIRLKLEEKTVKRRGSRRIKPSM